MQSRHAKLRAGLAWDESGWPWFELHNPPPPIPFDEYSLDDAEGWKTRILTDRPGPFRQREAPLIRFALWRCPDADVTDIVGWVHHSVADGLAAYRILGDLLHCYADAAAAKVPVDDGFSRDVRVPGGLARDAQWAAKAVWSRFQEQKFLRLSVSPKSSEPPGALTCWSLSADESAALIGNCRGAGVTVTAALAIAAFRALATEYGWDGQQIAWHAAINVRPQLSPPVTDDTIGCFVTSLRLYQRLERTADFWDAARQYHRDWDRRLRWVDPVRGLKIMDRVRLRSDLAAQRESALAISNLGRLTIKSRSGQPELLDFTTFAQANAGRGALSLHVATLHDRLRCTMRSEWLNADTLANLQRHLLNALRKAL